MGPIVPTQLGTAYSHACVTLWWGIHSSRQGCHNVQDAELCLTSVIFCVQELQHNMKYTHNDYSVSAFIG